MGFAKRVGTFRGPPALLRSDRYWSRVPDFAPIGLEEKVMKSLRLMLGAAVAVAGLALTSAANAAPGGIKLGELTCNVSSGFGFIFGSSKDLHCTFRPSGHNREHY